MITRPAGRADDNKNVVYGSLIAIVRVHLVHWNNGEY